VEEMRANCINFHFILSELKAQLHLKCSIDSIYDDVELLNLQYDLLEVKQDFVNMKIIVDVLESFFKGTAELRNS
jgi:hypothetical protein